MKTSHLLAVPFALLLAIPLLALIAGTPLTALAQAFHRPETLAALTVSFKTTSLTLVILVVFGTPYALSIARGPGWLKGPLATLAELPAVLPPSVAGIALLIAFGHAGLIGAHLPFEVTFTMAAVVLAQLFVASPFFLRPAAEAFAVVDPAILEAARLDGAGGLALASRVVWPTVKPAVLSALCLAWARALGEFGATLLFAGSFSGVTQTGPLAIYDAFETDLDAAKALGVILLAIAAIILIAAKWAGRYKA